MSALVVCGAGALEAEEEDDVYRLELMDFHCLFFFVRDDLMVLAVGRVGGGAAGRVGL